MNSNRRSKIDLVFPHCADIFDSKLIEIDLQHQLFLMTFDNKLHLAPIPDERLQNVLDIGTGTGIWAIDFGKRDVIFQVDSELT
jgi:ubiquinone/menaquinone biosynthesis C-methylase UbiE